MEDDIERGEKLKQELVREGWGGKDTQNLWGIKTIIFHSIFWFFHCP